MSHTPSHRSVQPPAYWSNDREMMRKLAQSVRGILKGQTNNHYEVTLEAGANEVVVPYPSARPGVAVLLTPCNQSAAAFQRANDIWTVSDNGSVKVSYGGTANGDEHFCIAIIG